MRKGNIFWSSEEEKKKEEPQQIEIYQAGPTTDDSNVMCEQNRIYFYSEVERNKNLKLKPYLEKIVLFEEKLLPTSENPLLIVKKNLYQIFFFLNYLL